MLVALARLYGWKSPRPLPPAGRWFQWLPKYWLEVSIANDSNDVEALIWELSDWLGPLGFEMRRQAEDELVFGRVSRVGDLTSTGARRVIIRVPLPVSGAVRFDVHYEASAVFDTGDLARFCHSLIRRQQDLSNEHAPLVEETGNPYQSPASS